MQKNSGLDSFNPQKSKCEICKEYVDKSNLLIEYVDKSNLLMSGGLMTFCVECFRKSMMIKFRNCGKPATQNIFNQDLLNQIKLFKQKINQAETNDQSTG